VNGYNQIGPDVNRRDASGAAQQQQGAARSYGPWSPAISREERDRQLRCLAGIIACHLGSGHPLVRLRLGAHRA
jgi:hypothetical protein